jgi:integral membrane protein
MSSQPSSTQFRYVAYAEAVTLLIVLSAAFVKRVLDGPDLVMVPGLIHGILVLVYFVLVLKIRESQGWGLGRTILMLVASAVPFGGFFAGRHVSDEQAPAMP